jgi:hypothetical protein
MKFINLRIQFYPNNDLYNYFQLCKGGDNIG